MDASSTATAPVAKAAAIAFESVSGPGMPDPFLLERLRLDKTEVSEWALPLPETAYPDLDTPAWGEPMSKNKTGNWRLETPAYLNKRPPCNSNCPAGTDVRDSTLQSVRERVGVVSQDAHLFHDTLRSNLLYAKPDATDEELVEALRAAQVWDLVSALPDGLDTLVGDRGHRLSGGEKQRLAIARLLLKDPSVMVLDEATAHLDSESEAAVQQALSNALVGRTSLVIAHRLATVRDADLILVVEAGRIVERGRHDELLAAGGLYADLSRTQLLGAQEAAAEAFGSFT